MHGRGSNVQAFTPAWFPFLASLRQSVSGDFAGALQACIRCRGLIESAIEEEMESFELLPRLWYLEHLFGVRVRAVIPACGGNFVSCDK